MLTFDSVRQLTRGLSGVEEGMCYSTPALRVRGKLFARLREDGDSLVLRTDPATRDLLLQAHPDVLYITDHYRDYPWVLVRLSRVSRDLLRMLIEDAWSRSAPKSLRAAGTRPRWKKR